MTLTLIPTEADRKRLQAMAASQSSGVAKRAQAQLRDMKTAELERELGLRRG